MTKLREDQDGGRVSPRKPSQSSQSSPAEKQDPKVPLQAPRQLNSRPMGVRLCDDRSGATFWGQAPGQERLRVEAAHSRLFQPQNKQGEGSARILETVSEKKKRGRPSVFARTLGDNSFAEVIKANTDTESARSVTNALYYHEGLCIAREVCDVSKIFFTSKGRSRRKCILEQLGRMKLQNHYDDESCKRICELSLKALEDGYTVREIENYIRHGRNHNEW